MSFPKLTFPLTVDFSSGGYWIGDAGPYKYGAAVTAFFIGDDLSDGVADDGIPLMRDLERYLQTFGGHLQPYVREEDNATADPEVFLDPSAGRADCSVCFALHPVEDASVMVERYSFSSLRDFLYVELGKAILHGNAPRQCRLCGRWFLHEQGDRAIYCERIAPGEEVKTCREVGARAVFENKLQSEETWKLYKRAYKKYYARVMKGNMSREDFNAWVERAAAKRDSTILLLEATKGAEKRTALIEELREELNKD